MRINSALQVGFLMLVTVGGTDVIAERDSLVDPTRPLGYSTISQPLQTELILNSVFISETSKIATINGQRVIENQIIQGAEVVSIQPGRVLLKRASGTSELRVHKMNIKHSTKKLEL